MKLILKNAGLTIKTYTTDSDAQALMSNYTKSLTDAQKKAVNNLVVSLKSANVWDRLTAGYFPCLASSINEAFFDAITNTSADTSQQNVYSLDNNGLGSVFSSSPYRGVRVNTNLTTSVQSIFASLYEVAEGDAHSSGYINYLGSIGGGYPKVTDSGKGVFPNSYGAASAAQIPAVTGGYINVTKHYALSWRYTENESKWYTNHADFCFEGNSIQLSPISESSDGTDLDNTWGNTLTLGSKANLNGSSGSGNSRCAMVLVFGETSTNERDAINTAIKLFNKDFFGES